jgi:threonylcarbamoyladenosine tRNA methylthiotransferase MtaB
MRVHLKTLGCRLNEAELETWARQFLSAGCELAAAPEQADVIVLNSCAVTGDAARKSRNLIRRLQRENPCAKLVASGCWATLHPDEAAQSLGVDLVVANADKSRLVELTREKLQLEAMPAFSTEPGEAALFSLGRQRAFVKVQDGCRYRCTFCIVSLARGAEKSRPVAEIVDEINALHAEGVQEAVLTGVHLGGYGGDLGTRLDELLRVVLAETDVPRIRLGSLEPWDIMRHVPMPHPSGAMCANRLSCRFVPEDFFRLWENPRLMPHLHLPLQSGADSVLKRMARRCRTADFAALVAEARREIPDLNLTTDILAGFPGETEAEWRQTLEFAERMAFGRVHIFAYSPRTGTAAATMPGQITDGVKKARVKELHALAARLGRDALARRVGRIVPVLWEERCEPSGDGRVLRYGYTPDYLRVAAAVGADEPLVRRIRSARLVSLAPDGESLRAELVDA